MGVTMTGNESNAVSGIDQRETLNTIANKLSGV